MKAREIRSRHFKSSVGSMLNENYGSGVTPETVQSEDFAYVPPISLPLSRSALRFLDHKFPEEVQKKPRSISTSDSLYQAYRKAVEQPQMMVHYDRDPFYWESKKAMADRKMSAEGSSDRDINLMEDYGRDGLVPSEVAPASTPQTVSSASSSRRLGAPGARNGSGIEARGNSAKALLSSAQKPSSGSVGKARTPQQKPPSGRLEDNRHRLWTPGSEAAGFKLYSPFTESLDDFMRKEAKFNAPEIPEAVLRTADAVAPPRYYDAFRKMMDLDPWNGQGRPRSVNVLKVHGNPEYPSKVMDDKDIPNYIAWAKIYPYCPLTQVEGKDKPVYVPPRGFTPSTDSKPPTPKARDMSKVKQNIMAGLKSCSASSKASRQGFYKSPPPPPPPPPSLETKLLQHQLKLQQSEQHQQQPEQQQQQQQQQPKEVTVAPQLGHYNADMFDKSVSRRILDMKMLAPDVWYTGRTPTHTPTPDYTLPIQPSKAWVKHYSPARVRRFIHAAATEARS